MYEHEHKYFIFKTQMEFVLYTGTRVPVELELYTKKEMAILGCPCGDVIKQVVRSAAA